MAESLALWGWVSWRAVRDVGADGPRPLLWCFEKTIAGMSRDTVIAALALAALLSSASYAQDGSATCVTCHAVEAA